MSMPVIRVIPPDTRAAGYSGHIGDHNAINDVLSGLEGQVTYLQQVIGGAASPTVPLWPSGDTTGTADTAAINAVIQAGEAALLSNGAWYVRNLLIDSYGPSPGRGRVTVLQAVAGTTG
jgi:hypothetical protein